MIDTLVSQMIQDNLRRTSNELEASRRQPLLPDAATEMIHASFLLSDLAERHWEFLRDKLTLGMEHRKLLRECREVEVGIRGIFKSVEATLLLLQSASLDQRMAQQFLHLKDRQEAMRGLLQKAEALRIWAETPLPAVDVASIPRMGDPLNREGFRSVDEILADLQKKRK